MRAGAWLTFRDVNAALSQLAAGPPGRRPPARRAARNREAMRICPRAWLCASCVPRRRCRRRGRLSKKLRRLTGAADDKLSLALAMAGHVMLTLVFPRVAIANRRNWPLNSRGWSIPSVTPDWQSAC